MSSFLMNVVFSTVFENDNFFSFTVFNYCSFNCCTFNCWVSNFHSVVTYCKHLVKCKSFSSFYTKLFYFNDIAFGYFVLFTTCCYNCLHMAPPIIITRQFRCSFSYKMKLSTSLCGILIYISMQVPKNQVLL